MFRVECLHTRDQVTLRNFIRLLFIISSHIRLQIDGNYQWLHPCALHFNIIEWEDSFPYDGEIETIAAEDCYSKEDVKQILALAKKNDLFVIPLIQTFGHMEFVLKGSKFKHLREVNSIMCIISSVQWMREQDNN